MRAALKPWSETVILVQKGRFKAADNTHTWPKENTPLTRVHIDWAYWRGQGNILVVVDSMSGWLEAVLCKDRETSTVINCLRDIFTRFGIPCTIVADKGPEFSSSQFHLWSRRIGSRILHTPEYHPQSNGVAERMVWVIKDGVSCFNPSKSTFMEFLQRLLLVHRNTSRRDGQAPAEIIFRRKLRCPISVSYTHLTLPTIYSV